MKKVRSLLIYNRVPYKVENLYFRLIGRKQILTVGRMHQQQLHQQGSAEHWDWGKKRKAVYTHSIHTEGQS